MKIQALNQSKIFIMEITFSSTNTLVVIKSNCILHLGVSQLKYIFQKKPKQNIYHENYIFFNQHFSGY